MSGWDRSYLNVLTSEMCRAQEMSRGLICHLCGLTIFVEEPAVRWGQGRTSRERLDDVFDFHPGCAIDLAERLTAAVYSYEREIR